MDKERHRSTRMMRHVVVGALTFGAVAAVGSGLGAGSAAAENPQGTWCPGQPLPAPPTVTFDWDMNVCHDWWYVPAGQGNVKVTDINTGEPVDFAYYWIGSPPVRTPPPPPPPPAPGSYCATNPIGCHFFGEYGPGYAG